jgi:hypothetical protein
MDAHVWCHSIILLGWIRYHVWNEIWDSFWVFFSYVFNLESRFEILHIINSCVNFFSLKCNNGQIQSWNFLWNCEIVLNKTCYCVSWFVVEKLWLIYFVNIWINISFFGINNIFIFFHILLLIFWNVFPFFLPLNVLFYLIYIWSFFLF